MSDLFARVRPVVGAALQGCTVAVLGARAAGDLVEYLALCGVQHWLVAADDGWVAGVTAELRARLGGQFAPVVTAVVTATVEARAALARVGLALIVDDGELAQRLPCTIPRLMIWTPRGDEPCRAQMALPGERLAWSRKVDPTSTLFTPLEQDEGAAQWATAAPLMAMAARALLLRGTAYAPASWEMAWSRGVRSYAVGAGQDPTQASWQPVIARRALYRSPRPQGGTLLVAGLGGLGSVAARVLAPWVERLILVDPDHVEVANLVRQAYRCAQVGEAKAVALAQNLGTGDAACTPVCVPVVTALQDDGEVAALIRREHVTAALVTTGTHADFAIARAARAAGIPHVVGRCYARARFWEGIVVDGAHGPSYADVRGAVAAGPLPQPPREEAAAYGAVPRQAGELVAEPATAMETGWAAQWLARLMAQMMLPVSLREGWLLARLAAGATCLIGGTVVEEGEAGAGGPAYGVRVPGEIHAWPCDATAYRRSEPITG